MTGNEAAIEFTADGRVVLRDDFGHTLGPFTLAELKEELADDVPDAARAGQS
jgi:hypothetical protein